MARSRRAGAVDTVPAGVNGASPVGEPTDPAAAPPFLPLGEASWRGYKVSELVEDLELALTSRALDDREILLQKQSRVFFQISGAGHEMLGLALARLLRPGYDWFFPYYRDRALVLGLGVSPYAIMLQAVGSADDPASGGRQMPCHWGDASRNIVTQSSPTGSQCLPAVGCAEAARYISRRNLPGCVAHGDEVTYVSLGEGATSEGEFWESLNTACRLHLPVLYVVADNGYAISVRASDQSPAPVSELVSGFRGLAVAKVDGCDYFAVRSTAAHLLARVRAGEGPGLLHATVTRPYSHSSADTQAKYRTPGELDAEAHHDPIHLFEAELIDAGSVTADALAALRERVTKDVADAAAAALAARRPDPATVTEHVWRLPAIPRDRERSGGDHDGEHAGEHAGDHAGEHGGGRDGDHDGIEDGGGDHDAAPAEGEVETVMLGEAIRRTLHEVMAADERIRVFGEDVADGPDEVLGEVEGKGGVFGTTAGLQRTFGIARCYNTPLAEANIVGRGVGQALRGLRPCAEIQFFDYIWTAVQQLRSEAATIRWRSAGAWRCPLVVRVPVGGYLTGGAIWHSQSGESFFTHVPGIVVLFPSRTLDAVRLLRTAFACEDPVLFLEHKHLLRQRYTAGPIPPAGALLPLGCGRIVRRGRDLTVVTWGATVQRTLLALEGIGSEGGGGAGAGGPHVEVLDLRCLAPWDQELVAESVARTHRLLVVHEDALTCGFGAEVAAWAGEHCFGELDAPIRRVGALDTPVPYEPAMEAAVLPQVDGIAAAIRELAAF